MMDNTGSDSSIHGTRGGMFCGRRTNGGIFCGLMLLIVGTILIAKKTGLIPLDMSLFWPSMMVLAGAWILVSTLLRSKRTS
jgi:hypothetical protein